MKKIISTPGAPRAIGPYSQAVCANGLLFLSGQIPLDPETGQLVEGGVEAQAERVLENLKAVLAAAGSSLSSTWKSRSRPSRVAVANSASSPAASSGTM